MHKVERNQAPKELSKKLIEFNNNFDNNINFSEEWHKFTRNKIKKRNF